MIKRSLGFSKNQVEGYSIWEEVKFSVFTFLVIVLFVSSSVLVCYKIPYPSGEAAILAIPVLISLAFVKSSMKQLEVENNKKSKSMFILATVFLGIGYIFLSLSMFLSTKVVEVTSSNVRKVEAVLVNTSSDSALLSIDGKFERIEGVSNLYDLSIGDTVTSISQESKVTHFKSWTGSTEDREEKTTILKINK